MKPESKIYSFFRSFLMQTRHFGFISKMEAVVQKMNLAEKIVFLALTFICIASGITLLWQVNDHFLVEIPSNGGNFSEGLVGSPRFINPVLAISDTDKDLTSLIYSGLLKRDGQNIITDLADSYEITDGGTAYYFVIKSNAYFQDGKPVTSDDVIFTINKILDPVIKSPRYPNWEGVSVVKISDKELRFVLKKPYEPFIEALTVGILPKHIWEKASGEEFPFSEFNVNPIGSGPYQIKKTERNSSGILNSVTLTSFHHYVFGRPKIDEITFKFFQNENELFKAYENKTIENAFGLNPELVKQIKNKDKVRYVTSLPRVFGVFFNQNIAPVLINKEVREALNIATPRQKIIAETLQGFGKPLNGPTPENIETDENAIIGDIEKAKNLLTANGWKLNPNGIMEKKNKTGSSTLSFAISTSDTPELKKTAELLKEAWTKIGANVEIKIFESGDLSQNIIKGRKYDALLFGEVIGPNQNLYPFWHSSERSEFGLNVSMYANITVDKLLEEIQRGVNIDESVKQEKLESVINEIKKDNPAIFLFSPDLIYIQSNKINNVSLKNISFVSDRFANIANWYIETDKVWKIFESK